MKDDKLLKRCEVKIRFSMFIRAESKVFGMNGRKQTNNEKPTKKTKPMEKQKKGMLRQSEIYVNCGVSKIFGRETTNEIFANIFNLRNYVRRKMVIFDR